ncbi:MAG: GNAT family N-acetyltransferase [Halobacteriota archaeon]
MPVTPIDIRPATAADDRWLTDRLVAAGLPTDDVDIDRSDLSLYVGWRADVSTSDRVALAGIEWPRATGVDEGGDESIERKPGESIDQESDESIDQESDESIDRESDESIDQESDESIDRESDESIDRESDPKGRRGENAALLRSVVVAPDHRGRGYGRAIVDATETLAARAGVDRLYLLTTDAAGFFQSCGYEVVDREAVPATIRRTEQFSSLCPRSATALRKRL